MSARTVMALVAIWVSLIAGNALAQHVIPSALLTIDQNRSTVVDRIVGEWGDRLARSNAGLSSAQLREILSGLRADHLLAASLAGNVEGLRNVVAGALVHTDAAIFPALMHAKALGDTGDDLVYTPIVPCRILDTRNGTTPPYNAAMTGGSAFPVAANLGNFAPQGGSATNCNLPPVFAAIVVTLTVLNPNFDAFLAAGSSNNFPTLTQAVVMDFSANRGLANTAIVPVDGTLTFYLGMPAQVTTNVIADAVGYLKPAVNTISGAFEVALNGNLALQIKPDAISPVLIAGSSLNTVTAGASGAAIGGGGAPGVTLLGNDCGSICANRVTDAFGTIGGGAANQAGNASGTTSDRAFATVGGGLRNQATGLLAAVGGGINNLATGTWSTVPGGFANTASGDASFAAGSLANANQVGCFVFAGWSSSANTPLSCLGLANVARFGLDHGLSVEYFAKNADGSGARSVYIGDAVAGQTITAWNGAKLTDAGVWVNAASSKTKKTDFAAVDSREVLAKVARLPITTWRFLHGEGEVRHIGPMAEDFWSAFKVGYGDHTIADLDARGVALAAIQGLHQTMRQQMRAKDKEIAELRRKLQAVEAKLGL